MDADFIHKIPTPCSDVSRTRLCGGTGAEFLAIGTGRAEAAGAYSTIQPCFRSCARPISSNGQPGSRAGATGCLARHAFWAPEIAESAGRWYLYYSVGHGDRLHQLRVAVSSEPLGPYIDTAALTAPTMFPSPSIRIRFATAMAAGICSTRAIFWPPMSSVITRCERARPSSLLHCWT